jgi:hypothetical protein
MSLKGENANSVQERHANVSYHPTRLRTALHTTSAGILYASPISFDTRAL